MNSLRKPPLFLNQEKWSKVCTVLENHFNNQFFLKFISNEGLFQKEKFILAKKLGNYIYSKEQEIKFKNLRNQLNRISKVKLNKTLDKLKEGDKGKSNSFFMTLTYPETFSPEKAWQNARTDLRHFIDCYKKEISKGSPALIQQIHLLREEKAGERKTNQKILQNKINSLKLELDQTKLRIEMALAVFEADGRGYPHIHILMILGKKNKQDRIKKETIVHRDFFLSLKSAEIETDTLFPINSSIFNPSEKIQFNEKTEIIKIIIKKAEINTSPFMADFVIARRKANKKNKIKSRPLYGYINGKYSHIYGLTKKIFKYNSDCFAVHEPKMAIHYIQKYLVKEQQGFERSFQKIKKQVANKQNPTSDDLKKIYLLYFLLSTPGKMKSYRTYGERKNIYNLSLDIQNNTLAKNSPGAENLDEKIKKQQDFEIEKGILKVDDKEEWTIEMFEYINKKGQYKRCPVFYTPEMVKDKCQERFIWRFEYFDPTDKKRKIRDIERTEVDESLIIKTSAKILFLENEVRLVA